MSKKTTKAKAVKTEKEVKPDEITSLLSLYKASLDIIVSKQYSLQEAMVIDKFAGLLFAQITQLEGEGEDETSSKD